MSFTSSLSLLQSLWSKLRSELGQGGPFWYSFISGCLVVTWLLLSGVYRVGRAPASWGRRLVFNYLLLPHLIPRIPLVGTATRFEALIACIYLLLNSLLVLVGPRAAIGSRAATMSIINVIPLLCGPRLSLVAKLLGMSSRSGIWSHQWFGRVAVAQALLHTLISLMGSSSFGWTTANVFGVVVGSLPCLARLLADVQHRPAPPSGSSSSLR